MTVNFVVALWALLTGDVPPQVGCAPLQVVADFVDILKHGGPWAIAAIAGWFAWQKDSQLKAAHKEHYEHLLKIGVDSTTALVKTETAVGALKEYIQLTHQLPRRGP